MMKNIFAMIMMVALVMWSIPAMSQNTGVDVITSPNSQGQGQGQGQSLVNSPEMDQSLNNNFEPNFLNDAFNDNSVTINEATQVAPIPGSVGYGPVINYFGKPLPSEGFQPVETILMYICWFSDGALESMLKGFDDAQAEIEIADLTYNDAPTREENGDTRYIKIVISRDRYTSENMDFIGYVTAKADGRNATMIEVMAAAALEAMKSGANVIHFTAQGAVRDVFSSGWGIGVNTTQAQINGAGHTNVSSGGMGYSSAKAGTRDLPWLQGFALVDYDLLPPVNVPMTR